MPPSPFSPFYSLSFLAELLDESTIPILARFPMMPIAASFPLEELSLVIVLRVGLLDVALVRCRKDNNIRY
jgi:hypothetical protein